MQWKSCIALAAAASLKKAQAGGSKEEMVRAHIRLRSQGYGIDIVRTFHESRLNTIEQRPSVLASDQRPTKRRENPVVFFDFNTNIRM